MGNKAWILPWWVRPANKHAQEVLFFWVRPGVMVWFHAVFLGSCLVFTFYDVFVTGFFLFFVLVLSLFKNLNIWLGFVFRLFWVLFFSFLKLSIVFKRIKHLVLSAGLFRFGYRGFPLLSHVVSMWFIVCSKLRWLVWIII